jgi:phage shock protein PspC (stress-responsive transcriptional regulator)
VFGVNIRQEFWEKLGWSDIIKLMKRIVRPKQGRMIAGVAAGMADYLGIDRAIVRLIWALLLLPGGLPGIIPYVICWIVIPEENKQG